MTENTHRVLSIKILSTSLCFLDVERKNTSFVPGQHIILALNNESRVYSILSTVSETFSVF